MTAHEATPLSVVQARKSLEQAIGFFLVFFIFSGKRNLPSLHNHTRVVRTEELNSDTVKGEKETSLVESVKKEKNYFSGAHREDEDTFFLFALFGGWNLPRRGSVH